ncbi:MAG TPA: hypothetical protein PLZ17_10070, partial [Pseudomonadota bacterium]|nr:hypothetical protein [Pseudomonadota bacterium]
MRDRGIARNRRLRFRGRAQGALLQGNLLPGPVHDSGVDAMSLYAELKRRNVFRVAAAYLVLGW